MEIITLITSKEPLEPETLIQLFPDLSENDRVKILATKVALQTNAPYEDMDVFENLVYILNGLNPDINKTELATPQMIWNAIEDLKKIKKDLKFSYEVLMYIKYIFNDNGYYFYPEKIGLDNPILSKIKEIAKSEKQLKENYLDIQTYRYKKLKGEV